MAEAIRSVMLGDVLAMGAKLEEVHHRMELTVLDTISVRVLPNKTDSLPIEV
jgi:hypothetical protein